MNSGNKVNDMKFIDFLFRVLLTSVCILLRAGGNLDVI